MTKCNFADRYKATRYPTCNHGKPCDTCLKKWHEQQQLRAYMALCNAAGEF